MKLFPFGHVTHPDWRMAVALVVAQLRGRMAQAGYATAPGLGLVYFSDAFARHAPQLLEALQDEFPQISDWSGSVAVGVMASHAEYLDEPALSVMLLELPPQSYRLFSGIAPLPMGHDSPWERALVHADAGLPDLGELLEELAERTRAGSVLGGLSSEAIAPLQLAWSKALGPSHSGVLRGGLSGLAFSPEAGVVQALTQGCQVMGARMRITAMQGHVVLELDGRPALDVLEELMLVRLDADPERATRAMRHIHAALEPHAPESTLHAGQLGPDARVVPLVGVDMASRGIVLSEAAQPQHYLCFCQRNLSAARADLLRMCAELRESLSPVEADTGELATGQELPSDAAASRGIAGAVYISCAARGASYFGAPGAELELIHHVLGDIPLLGFFSQGEIAGQQLHRYAGALMLFTQPA
ncbi:hypothetical protein GCM10027276_30420 [Comamonas piscis]